MHWDLNALQIWKAVLLLIGKPHTKSGSIQIVWVSKTCNTILESIRGAIAKEKYAKSFLKKKFDWFVANEKVEKSIILTKFVSMRHKGKGNISEYILEMSNLVIEPKAFKLELSENILVYLVLISLPMQFSQI